MAKDLMWILSRPLDDDVTKNRIRLDSSRIRIEPYALSETDGVIYFCPVRVYVKTFGY